MLDWDGHQPATEPGNPDIVYGERQEGTLSRIDMKTGEIVDIQPQPAEGEPYERFKWDSPILVSPHKPTTIYFASQRVWKSENRGDAWTAISPDLTKTRTGCNYPSWGAHRVTTMPGICLPCQTTIPSHRFLNHRIQKICCTRAPTMASSR